MADPFHSGEREIQERTGERELALKHGRMIAKAIPSNAHSFLTQQHYCALGWVSPIGDIWASFITGHPGFAVSNDTGSILSFDLDDASARAADIPPFCGLRLNDKLGVLFIELATRRRLRVNGCVSELSISGLRLAVAEAFPNCPKYIHRRDAVPRSAVPGDAMIEKGEDLNDALVAWLAATDTLFVASAHHDCLVDVSHRGGRPGFVGLKDDALYIPDYPGNSLFSTLGNFMVNPRAGIAIPDFQRNRQLQLTGDVRLDLDAGENTGKTGGTGRWWMFSPRRWIISPLGRSFNWTLVDTSPFNP